MLRTQVDNLIASIAHGVPAATIAPAIRERKTEIARLDKILTQPRQAKADIDRLRVALTEKVACFRADLKAEPRVARMLLRRLIGPITLWSDTEPGAECGFRKF